MEAAFKNAEIENADAFVILVRMKATADFWRRTFTFYCILCDCHGPSGSPLE